MQLCSLSCGQPCGFTMASGFRAQTCKGFLNIDETLSTCFDSVITRFARIILKRDTAEVKKELKSTEMGNADIRGFLKGKYLIEQYLCMQS